MPPFSRRRSAEANPVLPDLQRHRLRVGGPGGGFRQEGGQFVQTLWRPKSADKVTPEAKSEVRLMGNEASPPKPADQGTPEVAPEGTPEVAPEVAPEVTPEVARVLPLCVSPQSR